MKLDDAIRNAKPEYNCHNIDSVTLEILNALDKDREDAGKKASRKKWAVFVILPLAIAGGVGFLTHTDQWGVKLPSQNVSPAQMKAEALNYDKNLAISVMPYGGFVHAKQAQSFSNSEIVYGFSKVNSSTKEIIIQGEIPFIRQDVILPNNIKYPDNSLVKSQQGKFIQARHAINLPSNEISHSFDEITDNTKEILAPNTPPFIRLDVIPPDDRAAVDQ